MPFAVIAPAMQPPICAGTYARTSRRLRPPKAASTSETTGLKCPPETGPNIKLFANSKDVLALMQTRAELYEYLGYEAYEQKLDQLFAAGKQS